MDSPWAPRTDPPHTDPEAPTDGSPEPWHGRPTGPAWRQATPWLAGMEAPLVLGLAAAVVGGFLHQIWATSGGGSDGLADTAGWLLWAGQVAAGGALAAAAVREGPATPPIRMALLALGVLVVLGAATGLLASLL